MIPDGYTGGSVWSSTPALDRDRRTVYITTSNNYTVPASVTACQNAGGTPAECMSPGNRIDSIVALDIRTGEIKWSTGAGRFDAWTAACIPGKPPRNCPDNPGEDYAFSDGPHLFEINGRKVVGAGQKSGEYWTVDAATGEIVWGAAPGPGSKIGGIMWGTATDSKRIYLAEANYDARPYTLPNGQTITWGSYAALDAATGRIIWQVGDPDQHHPIGAVTVANDVVYAGSMTGRMYAFDAATGAVLWSHQGQGSVASGAAVVDGTVYWGNGYYRDGFGKASTTLYAFSLAD
jgi:polyvinyl alcohol dehydrogenase (cytochrome)